MNNLLQYGWIISLLLSYLIIVIITFILYDSDKVNRSMVFFEIIGWILNIMGTILFIIWLFKFKNKNTLKYMWIISLIIFVLSITSIIFLYNEISNKILIIPSYLTGYSFLIFIGTLIAFFVKK
tara:strand:+ start:1417 stop:1788 length:372 start_codon:yes stop_codon:yes gene_type:complete